MHKDDGNKRASNPEDDLFECFSDGWDSISAGFNVASTTQLVEEAFSDVQGVGDCKQVQVKVGLISTSVCSKDC